MKGRKRGEKERSESKVMKTKRKGTKLRETFYFSLSSFSHKNKKASKKQSVWFFRTENREKTEIEKKIKQKQH